jgi:lysophospholipase L1-like esterase
MWLCQLALPGLILLYAVSRLGDGWPPVRILRFSAAVSAVWVGGVVLSICSRRIREWLVSRRYQLTSCFAGAVFAFVLGDLALSLSGIIPDVSSLRNQSLEYRPSAFTQSRLVPKTLHAPGLPSISINSRGYRGPEIAIPKLAGTLRICFVGGSQVFDYFWSGGENWPARAGEILSQEGLPVEVINAGVPGHFSSDSLGKMLSDLWYLEPDIIVASDSWNDIKYFSVLSPAVPCCDFIDPITEDWRINPKGIDRLLCASSLFRWVRYQFLIKRGEGKAWKAPVGTIGEFGVRQYRLNLQTLCDLGKNIGVEIALCKEARLPVAGLSDSDKQRIAYRYVGLSYDELLKAFALCDRVIDEVAAQKHCRVMDLSRPLSGKPEYFKDHVHFSSEGSRQAAQVVARELKPLVEERIRSRSH